MAWEPNYIYRTSRMNIDRIRGLNTHCSGIVLDEELSGRFPRHRTADVNLVREAPVRVRSAQIPNRRWRGGEGILQVRVYNFNIVQTVDEDLRAHTLVFCIHVAAGDANHLDSGADKSIRGRIFRVGHDDPCQLLSIE